MYPHSFTIQKYCEITDSLMLRSIYLKSRMLEQGMTSHRSLPHSSTQVKNQDGHVNCLAIPVNKTHKKQYFSEIILKYCVHRKKLDSTVCTVWIDWDTRQREVLINNILLLFHLMLMHWAAMLDSEVRFYAVPQSFRIRTLTWGGILIQSFYNSEFPTSKYKWNAP